MVVMFLKWYSLTKTVHISQCRTFISPSRAAEKRSPQDKDPCLFFRTLARQRCFLIQVPFIILTLSVVMHYLLSGENKKRRLDRLAGEGRFCQRTRRKPWQVSSIGSRAEPSLPVP